MDLYDFPQFSEDMSAVAAASEFDRMRNELPEAWMTEDPIKTDISSFTLSPEHNRYTVSVDEVPFECLYFPDNENRLYIMLSAGGTTTRRYPSFMRWKYKNYLKGHLVCIDDPMYYFHPGLFHVMWYYGTKDKSYLALLIELIKNIAAQLSIPPENVTIIGSSGGGYAALYAGNRIDHSSVIAINPQFYPKSWTSTAAMKSFKSWGIDLNDENEKFGRNSIVLDNKTSYFLVVSNLCSEQDFVQQLCAFVKDKDYTPSYGISQHGNLITWVHNTPYRVPHWVIPEKVSIAVLDHILQKCKKGYNANELTNISSLFNEVLIDKYTAKTQLEEKNKAPDKADTLMTRLIFNRLKKAFPSNITDSIKERLGNSAEVSLKIYSPSNTIFYIGSQRNIRYQLLYYMEDVFFCLLINDPYSLMTEDRLESFLSASGMKYRFGKQGLICSASIDPDDIYGSIDNVIEKSIELMKSSES